MRAVGWHGRRDPFNISCGHCFMCAGWMTSLLLFTDDDPLGVDTFATHHVPLADAPDAYSMFQTKSDGAIKVVFNP